MSNYAYGSIYGTLWDERLLIPHWRNVRTALKGYHTIWGYVPMTKWVDEIKMPWTPWHLKREAFVTIWGIFGGPRGGRDKKMYRNKQEGERYIFQIQTIWGPIPLGHGWLRYKFSSDDLCVRK